MEQLCSWSNLSWVVDADEEIEEDDLGSDLTDNEIEDCCCCGWLLLRGRLNLDGLWDWFCCCSVVVVWGLLVLISVDEIRSFGRVTCKGFPVLRETSECWFVDEFLFGGSAGVNFFLLFLSGSLFWLIIPRLLAKEDSL